MRGLITKDFLLIFKRKQTLIIFAVLALVMGFAMDGTFIIGYITMLTAIVSISTISYDEFENGFSYLMTLPVSRKTYVLEKYLFCSLMGLAGWCVAMVIYMIANLVKQIPVNLPDELPMLFAILPVMLLFTSAIIPLQLKFGVEKSRIAIFAIYGGMALVVFLASKLLSKSSIDVSAFVAGLSTLSPALVLILLLTLWLAVTAVSYLISVRIMEKKEF
jgi:hypothetical protein